MKEKRYFCDLLNSRAVSLISFIFTLLVVILPSTIYYHAIKSNISGAKEYPESSYIYLDYIADKIASNKGIDTFGIPESITEWKIICDDDKIIFTYILNPNYDISYKDGEFVFEPTSRNRREKVDRPSVEMTVTFSRDFEIIDKSYISYSDWKKQVSSEVLHQALLLGFTTTILITILFFIGFNISVKISKRHKQKDKLGGFHL